MMDSVFYDFYRASGFKVYSSPSTDWCEIQKGMLISIPFHRLIQPTQDEIEQVLDISGAFGLRYPTGKDNYGFDSSLAFCRSVGYGLKHLNSKVRNQVRKGQKYINVRKVDFIELTEAGLELNRKTCQRQKREDPKVNRNYWKRVCDAGRQTEGANAFGAYFEDRLAAYLIVLETPTAAEIIIQNSDSELLHLCPNNALTYSVTQHYLSETGAALPVCYGLGSLEETVSLDHFKIGMGYQIEAIKQCLYFRQSVKWLIQPRALRITEWMRQNLMKRNYFLRKICGIMRCYLAQGKI